MRKLTALLRAFAIVFVAIFPGIGAVFTMSAGDHARFASDEAPPKRLELVGTYEDESGDLRLSFRPVVNAPNP